MEITYNQDQIVAMSSNEIKLLGLLCPKKVFMQLETSGSASVWTRNGESLKGFTGNDIIRCAEEIRTMDRNCADYNRNQHGDNRHNFYANIRVVFLVRYYCKYSFLGICSRFLVKGEVPALRLKFLLYLLFACTTGVITVVKLIMNDIERICSILAFSVPS